MFYVWKPLEIWKDQYIPEGLAMFLPIHKLECRCVAANSTIPVPNSAEDSTTSLPGCVEERVLFVSPLPDIVEIISSLVFYIAEYML